MNNYRADIDGLRAVAVLAILLFHVDHTVLPGGYVGVDVFFVISGFLITRNIVEAVASGSFSFVDFYTRRARRLFPALFVTLLATYAAALWLFSPVDLENYGASLLYTVISASNFFFWSGTGYFEAASETMPLLHTWSLSVEEQFYLLWPALLVGLAMLRRKYAVPLALALLGLGSLAVAAVVSFKSPAATFYLLPSRVFEFAIGAACVWLVRIRLKPSLPLEALTALGLALIAWSAYTYTPQTPFPKFAVLPCLGTALLIYAGEAHLAGVLLRNPVSVGIGRVSYSVYLVHWPLIVFYKYWKFTPLNQAEKGALLALSLVLGALMWRFVEEPFRRPASARAGFPSIRFAGPALALVLSFVAANTWGHKGFPARFPHDFFMTSDEIAAERSRYWAASGVPKGPASFVGSGPKTVVVMGNSHAVDLVYALRQNGATAHFAFLQTGYKCLNFGSPVVPADREYCSKMKAANLSDAVWRKADAVFLHDNWPRMDAADLHQRLLEIRSVTKADIYVFGPKMTYSKDPGELARAHMRKATLNQFSQEFTHRKDRTAVNEALKQMLDSEEMRRTNVFFVDVLGTQCGEDASHCEIVSSRDSRFLYFDAGHFTAVGAAELGERLKAKHPEVFQ
ncbi:acyltransferase family protein [Ramlibacter sp. Leaf400]|uniref:acyltransferase family protein n=1 Tax=Ramlibacter sp. Leaf400 TaxID=1736365 RepID=UPI0006FD50CD|nr:acyltransferase family protein [Ramlibacter sp. Leaf400]KQT14378.1 hypothetical protein ASG30_02030 [Ramlibacter sp. Leaf400]